MIVSDVGADIRRLVQRLGERGVPSGRRAKRRVKRLVELIDALLERQLTLQKQFNNERHLHLQDSLSEKLVIIDDLLSCAVTRLLQTLDEGSGFNL